MVTVAMLRPRHGLRDQCQPLLAEATPEDMTIAATMAAQRRATRIFVIDIGVRLLFGFP
jgi:hypothetical protein